MSKRMTASSGFLACLLFAAGCSGTAALEGKSNKKGQGGGEDERTSADSPTQVSGAFLTSCGGAIAAPGSAAPSSSDQTAPFGCVVSRSDGSKADARIDRVTLSFDDGTTTSPALTPAPKASAWTVLFTMSAAKWSSVKRAAVAAQLPSGPAVLTDAAPQSHATSCPAGGFFNQASRACETLLTLDAWENPISPDFVFGLPTDKTDLTGLGWTDDGPSFGALPPGPCGGSCPAGTEDPRVVTIDRLQMPLGLHFFCIEGSSECASAQANDGFTVEGPVFRAIAPWACDLTPGAQPVYRWVLPTPAGGAHFYTMTKNLTSPGATSEGTSFCLFPVP